MSESHAWKRSELRADIRRAMPRNPKSARTRLSISELWRIFEVLGGEVPESHRRHAQDTKNVPELREWIADELDFDYDPEGRVRPFKNAELAKIRDVLQEDADDVE